MASTTNRLKYIAAAAVLSAQVLTPLTLAHAAGMPSAQSLADMIRSQIAASMAQFGIKPATISQPSTTPIPTPKPSPTSLATPVPVITTPTGQSIALADVVYWTNVNRRQNGLPDLTMNTKLNSAAASRSADMFAKQYFAHTAPDGKSFVDAVNAAGYAWHALAENIASASPKFESAQQLVQMWMNSPGHRANILSPNYTEIGVDVRQGTLNGQSTWIGVQLFGHP